MSTESGEATFEGYAVMELMGHRRLGGYVREATLAGGAFLRIDVPKPDSPCWEANAPPTKDETAMTAFYPPHTLYALTPVAGQVAHVVAKANVPQPITRWDITDAGFRLTAAKPPNGAPPEDAHLEHEEDQPD